MRDSIAPGKLIGPRLLVAGNIVGWGGPRSPLYSDAAPTTFFDERMMDFIARGSGEDLLDMSPDELRAAMRAYQQEALVDRDKLPEKPVWTRPKPKREEHSRTEVAVCDRDPRAW